MKQKLVSEGDTIEELAQKINVNSLADIIKFGHIAATEAVNEIKQGQ